MRSIVLDGEQARHLGRGSGARGPTLGVLAVLSALLLLAPSAAADGREGPSRVSGPYSGVWAVSFPADADPVGEISFRRLAGKADGTARNRFSGRLRDCVRADGSVLYEGNFNYGGKGRVEACEDPATHQLHGYYVNRGGRRGAGHGTFTLSLLGGEGQRSPRFEGTYSRATTGSVTAPEDRPWGGVRKYTFSRVSITFRGYANNVRVVPPLVGDYQLGISRVRGSATIDLVTGQVYGQLVDRDALRRGSHGTRERVIGAVSIRVRPNLVRVALDTRVVRSLRGNSCPRRTVGRLVIIDHAGLLPNGHPRDGFSVRHPLKGGPLIAPDGGRACRTHIHGYNNTDGGARTSPAAGGPPSGGQWAIVSIGLS